MLVTQKHLTNINAQRIENSKGYTKTPGNHGISPDKIKKLPSLISKPALIIKGTGKQKGTVIVVTTEKDYKGRQIIVPIQPNGTAVYDGITGPVNCILSMYGYGNTHEDIAAYIADAAKKGGILYANKGRCQALLNNQYTAGVYSAASSALQALGFDTILGQADNLVKTKLERRFSVSPETDAEYLSLAENPEVNRDKLQEMVDEAAKAAGYNTPILYHGTGRAVFTEFDLNKMDDGTSIFSTNRPDVAATYAGSLKSAESIVRNPGTKRMAETSNWPDRKAPIADLVKAVNDSGLANARTLTEAEVKRPCSTTGRALSRHPPMPRWNWRSSENHSPRRPIRTQASGNSMTLFPDWEMRKPRQRYKQKYHYGD